MKSPEATKAHIGIVMETLPVCIAIKVTLEKHNAQCL